MVVGEPVERAIDQVVEDLVGDGLDLRAGVGAEQGEHSVEVLAGLDAGLLSHDVDEEPSDVGRGRHRELVERIRIGVDIERMLFGDRPLQVLAHDHRHLAQDLFRVEAEALQSLDRPPRLGRIVVDHLVDHHGAECHASVAPDCVGRQWSEALDQLHPGELVAEVEVVEVVGDVVAEEGHEALDGHLATLPPQCQPAARLSLPGGGHTA